MGIFSKISRSIKHHAKRAAKSVVHATKRLSHGDLTPAKKLFDDGLHSVKRLHNNLGKNEIIGSYYRGGIGNTIGKGIDEVEKKRYLINHAGSLISDQRKVISDLKSGNILKAIKSQGGIIAKIDSGGKVGNLSGLAKSKVSDAIEKGYSKSTKFVPDSIKKKVGALSASDLAKTLERTELGRSVKAKIGKTIQSSSRKAFKKIDDI